MQSDSKKTLHENAVGSSHQQIGIKTDCFAHRDGYCSALTCMFCATEKCNFYKTEREMCKKCKEAKGGIRDCVRCKRIRFAN